MTDIRIFEVGGSIRDELMGITDIPDRDFCAVSPDGWRALLHWCHDNMKRVFLVTPEFFTVRGMMHDGTSIDVVMCRKDGPSSDGRRPDEVEPGTLQDDLARRDFTMNALAREVDPKTLEPIGDIVDLFGGVEDILHHSLRTVGNSNERFEEDGLRILRAARFCVTKGVGPTPSIAAALRDPKWWEFVMQTVSVDRIRVELHKMFTHNTVDAIRFLTNSCAHDALTCMFGSDEKGSLWMKPTVEKK